MNENTQYELQKSSYDFLSYSRKAVVQALYVSTTPRGVKNSVHNFALEIISLYGHTPLGKNRHFLHNRWADSLGTGTVRKPRQKHTF